MQIILYCIFSRAGQYDVLVRHFSQNHGISDTNVTMFLFTYCVQHILTLYCIIIFCYFLYTVNCTVYCITEGIGKTRALCVST